MNAPPTREAVVTPVDLARTEDFAFGSARVRPSAREIDIGGRTERLQPRVMQVLTALARARGAVVSRDDLIEACWEGLAVGEDAINRVIGKLRRLAELAPDAFTIETVSKVGYRLIVDPPTRHHDPNGEGALADLAEVGAPAPGDAARGRPAPILAALRGWRTRIGPRGLIAVGVAILVAALALGAMVISGP